MRRQFGVEFVGVEFAPAGDDDVIAGVPRAPDRALDGAGLVPGRKGQRGQRIAQALARCFPRRVAVSPRRVEAMKICTRLGLAGGEWSISPPTDAT
jgi:hypothetical protein